MRVNARILFGAKAGQDMAIAVLPYELDYVDSNIEIWDSNHQEIIFGSHSINIGYLHGYVVTLSEDLTEFLEGNDGVINKLVSYYVEQFRFELEAGNVPLLPFSDLHEICDPNQYLIDVIQLPVVASLVPVDLYDLVPVAYNRSLQG